MIKFKNNSGFKGVKNAFLNNYQSSINDINLLEKNLKFLNDSELRAQSFKLQQEYNQERSLNSLINRSFALTREISSRTLGLRHFDVQLIGGLVLNENKIAEMKTGEGKTLVATLPASLNAFTKKGVHIVTVNEYLANRDQVSMGQVYRFLGFNTGLIKSSMQKGERQKNYQSSITYVTNSELTFDFLRDNIVPNKNDLVLRPFNYCIIDEVDSILIDEAQTPIILAQTGDDKVAEKYIISSAVVNYLELNKHYKVDEKNRNVTLTELGSQQVEQILQINDLYNVKDPWIPYIINALKAITLLFKNIHYIVQNNRIIIVDEFTGRIMPDRRWGDGLHQAIEAKERVPIRPRTDTQASITYQNFFLMYPKLSGMTGTGKTGQAEFEKIYNLPVNIIPTYRPIQRIDFPDKIYQDQFTKWEAIAKFCNDISLTEQPILIGTTTVEKSEMLAQLLNEYKLSYQILNAKPENVRRESQIIGQAGQRKSITIATNMAGRGTDIILGGNINFYGQQSLYTLLIIMKLITNRFESQKHSNFRQFRYKLIKNVNRFKDVRTIIGCSQQFYNNFLSLTTNFGFLNLSDINVLRILQENDRILIPQLLYQCNIRFLLNRLILTNKKHHFQENKIVKNLGGLCVIGTERNDSRRVDNQLIGRCGRQGDPGASYFFLSLDDNLLRLFGADKIQFLTNNNASENFPISGKWLTRALKTAQERVEERAYEQRKNLFDYDESFNKQRNIIYFERRFILENTSFRNNLLAFGEQICQEYLTKILKKKLTVKQGIQIFENLFSRSLEIYDLKQFSSKWDSYDYKEWKIYFYQEFWITYNLKLMEFLIYDKHLFENCERQLLLISIDKVWKEHLEKLTLLREAVSWRGYGQQNPLTEYKRESYKLFCERKEILMYFVIYYIVRLEIV